MSYFNQSSYVTTNTNYNVLEPTYIDGSSNPINLSGINYYNSTFGNVMASFVLDRGDAVLGGNVIVSGNLINPATTLANSIQGYSNQTSGYNICNSIKGYSTGTYIAISNNTIVQ